jgi:threonine aldolase
MNLPPLNLADDGLDLSPRDMARLLARLTEESPVERDAYGIGPAIAAFEERLATSLGKERAILAPSGTLANLLALKLHTSRLARRVVVQADGHIAGDTGDGAASLVGATLVPLQDRGAGFSAEALAAALAAAAAGRVATPIAAVAIETPVRRRHAQL